MAQYRVHVYATDHDVHEIAKFDVSANDDDEAEQTVRVIIDEEFQNCDYVVNQHPKIITNFTGEEG